jgi:hypothetical protein
MGVKEGGDSVSRVRRADKRRRVGDWEPLGLKKSFHVFM